MAPGAIFLASMPTGTDELGRSTRARVESLSAALADAGYEPRLGGIAPPPGSVPTPRGGVQVAILCLTQSYMKMSDPARRAEFEALVAVLGRDRLLAVALEPCCAKPIPPPGPVGGVLHGLNPTDLSAADGSQPYALGIAELIGDIVALSGAGRVQHGSVARQPSHEVSVPSPEPPQLRAMTSRSTAGLLGGAQSARDGSANSPATTPGSARRPADSRRNIFSVASTSPTADAAEAVVVIAAANRKPSEVKAAQTEVKASQAALASAPAMQASLMSPSAQSGCPSPGSLSRRPSNGWRDSPSAAAVDPQLGIVRPSEIKAGLLLGRAALPGSPAASQPGASGLTSPVEARSRTGSLVPSALQGAGASPVPAIGMLSPRSQRDSLSSRSGRARRPMHATVPITELSVDDLTTLLNNLGFARYTPAIAAAGLDGAQICGATHSSLEALGVNLLHRRAILGRVEGFAASGVPALLLDESVEPIMHPHDCMTPEGDLLEAGAEADAHAASQAGRATPTLDQQMLRIAER